MRMVRGGGGGGPVSWDSSHLPRKQATLQYEGVENVMKLTYYVRDWSVKKLYY